MVRGRNRSQDGFSLMELVVVITLIATLVLIAIPVYLSARGLAEKRACFENQNALLRSAEVYVTMSGKYTKADLAGVVTADHPLVRLKVLRSTPRCPSGIKPTDPRYPMIVEGAYQFSPLGELEGCPSGELGAHGSVND